jgi:hypothetical protein
VAIGPKNWGRAGPDCSIRTDSIKQPIKIGHEMDEVEIKKQLSEMQGRLDAANQEIEKQKAFIKELEDPNVINNRVNARLKLINQCQDIMGDVERLDALSDYELKIAAIKKHYPDTDLKDKDQNYIDGMFEAILATKVDRTDSLINTREAIYADKKAELAYEKWLSYSANLWSSPLMGSLQGGR